MIQKHVDDVHDDDRQWAIAMVINLAGMVFPPLPTPCNAPPCGWYFTSNGIIIYDHRLIIENIKAKIQLNLAVFATYGGCLIALQSVALRRGAVLAEMEIFRDFHNHPIHFK